MRDCRRSSPTYTESLFLHVVKHNLLFFCFCFSIWLFFHEYSQFTGQQMKREAISLYSFYHFHPLNRHLDIFFSIWVFFHEYSRFTGQQRKGEGISLTPLCHFHTLHRHFDISWVIAAESSPLHTTGSRNGTWNLWYKLIRIHHFFTCTGTCCC